MCYDRRMQAKAAMNPLIDRRQDYINSLYRERPVSTRHQIWSHANGNSTVVSIHHTRYTSLQTRVCC